MPNRRRHSPLALRSGHAGLALRSGHAGLASRSGHAGLAALAGWVLVAPPAVAAAARLARREGSSGVLMAQAFGPLLGTPALAALGVALATRRRGLAWAAATVTGLHLAWLASDLRAASPPIAEAAFDPSDAAEAGRLRLFSANVLFTNTYLDSIAAEVRDADPDLVILQEVSPPTLAGLDRAGTLDAFPYRAVFPRPDPMGTAILSRFPLDDVEPCTIGGFPMSRATIIVGDHRVCLYNVHTRAPFGPGGYAQWTTQLAALGEIVAAETGPVIVAGDFNAASGHRPFRALLSAGVRDAHLDRRRWWATTWPSDLRLAPPFALIDHVLVSPQVGVQSVSEGVGRGSDHRPVIADLAVLGRRDRAPGQDSGVTPPGRILETTAR